MKYLIKIPVCVLSAALFLLSCSDDKTEDYSFGIDRTSIEIGANGGSEPLKVTSRGNWQATTDAPWIKLSPSNGMGITECRVEIDSSVLAVEPRSAIVQIISDDQTHPQAFKVIQQGYEKFIRVEQQPEILPSYGPYGERTLKVEITANVPFEIAPNVERPWVLCEEIDMKKILDRGARPRTITLEFEWENNTRPEERQLNIEFVVDEMYGELARHDLLTLKQTAAEKIVPGIRGDSLAIMACKRSLDCGGFEEGEQMSKWNNVILWEPTDENVLPENIGRVRSVKFMGSNAKDGIPFEIQYLTAAETIMIFSNSNKLQKNFSTGPDLSKLEQLKHLQIYSFGLTELDPSFKELKNLETLDLSGNNFETIPSLLTPENFPNLTYLDLTANRRRSVMDMNTTMVPDTDWGGLWKSTSSKYNQRDLERLLAWEKLEFLRLSNNYMQYGVPTMVNKTKNKWQKGDQYRLYWDSETEDYVWHDIPEWLVGKPKVLPNATYFALNLNYFTGEIPEWILYHPQLFFWNPGLLVFNQNQKYMDKEGNPVGFTNIPATLDYYYEIYPEQKNLDEEAETGASDQPQAKMVEIRTEALSGIRRMFFNSHN